MTDSRETSTKLDPKFDENGLITAVCTDEKTGDVLMVAHMTSHALTLTLEGGKATFWSRSRGRIWTKGETSGHYLHVVEARIDCDQDALWLKCRSDGPACHTSAASCFYRRLDGGDLVRDA
jgi:phosphoribosyl-AMP cyclohydrolase